VTDTYELDDDPQRLDLDAVWTFLTTQAYWGRWRGRDDVERQIASAWRVIGAYVDGRQVGFARAVSDGVAVGYLADVYVDEAHRGQGIARAMVTALVEHDPGRDFRWMLHTKDAHALYEQLGFTSPDETYMERPASLSPGSG
jgi:GNAT superfamily N-acetyltransferase